MKEDDCNPIESVGDQGDFHGYDLDEFQASEDDTCCNDNCTKCIEIVDERL
jgi:hypothetical protein